MLKYSATYPAPRRSDDGFTLIEILVVFVIIGVLMAVMVPSYMKAKRTTRDNAMTQAAMSYKNAIEAFRLDHGGRAPVIANYANQHDVDWKPSPLSSFRVGPRNASMAKTYTSLGPGYMRSDVPEPVTKGWAGLCYITTAVNVTAPTCAGITANNFGAIQYRAAGIRYRIDVYSRVRNGGTWKHLCTLGNQVAETC